MGGVGGTYVLRALAKLIMLTLRPPGDGSHRRDCRWPVSRSFCFFCQKCWLKVFPFLSTIILSYNGRATLYSLQVSLPPSSPNPVIRKPSCHHRQMLPSSPYEKSPLDNLPYTNGVLSPQYRYYIIP